MRSEQSALLLLFLAGCPAVDPSQGLPTTPVSHTFDYNDFVCEAMPVLIKRCSYPGCHGNERRAFRVYSSGKLRAGDVATRDARDGVLTTAELQLNFDSATGVLLGAVPATGAPLDVGKALLLSKPLAARLGGDEHNGVAVFPTYPRQTLEEDPDWNALVDWATGRRQPTPLGQACSDLFTALGAKPK